MFSKIRMATPIAAAHRARYRQAFVLIDERSCRKMRAAEIAPHLVPGSAKASDRCGHIHPPDHSNPGGLFHLPETRNGDVMMQLAMKAAMRSYP
jgi:hypothetical protein